MQAPLFVLADGMGGAQAGEVASELAIEAFREALPRDQDGLVHTIETANARVHESSERTPEYHGMGTTCTVAYVAEEEVIIGHVGDSRAYLLRDGELIRVTVDHSLVGELVARGKVTEEEALTHPQRSVITRAVGPEPTVKVDAERIAARAGDVFLLCSDGLTDMIRDRDVHRILAAVPSLEQAGRNLIAAANARRRPRQHHGDPLPPGGGRRRRRDVRLRVGHPGHDHDARGHRAAAGRFRRRRPGAPSHRRPTGSRRAVAASEPTATTGWRRILKPLLVVGILLVLFGVAGFVAMRGVFFVGLDEQPERDHLPRPALHGARRHQALHARLHVGRAHRPGAGRAPEDLHRPQAALPRRRDGPRAPARDRQGRSERPQPRAARARPGVAAGGGRVRGDLHPALDR